MFLISEQIPRERTVRSASIQLTNSPRPRRPSAKNKPVFTPAVPPSEQELFHALTPFLRRTYT
jgi:hypothetical protein